MCCLLQDVAERSRVLQVEALEEQLVKSRKHAAAMQSKLDTAFTQYHNDIQEMQAKSDDLVRKNKSLRNKNKGMRLPCRVLFDGSLR
jgi:low affinity Fe/Cu permease